MLLLAISLSAFAAIIEVPVNTLPKPMNINPFYSLFGDVMEPDSDEENEFKINRPRWHNCRYSNDSLATELTFSMPETNVCPKVIEIKYDNPGDVIP